jgi:hypothetical protein
MKASRETIKMKTSEGEVKVAVLGDSPGAEEYLQHLNAFLRMLIRKKLVDDLLKCTKAVVSAAASVRKHSKVQNGERAQEMADRLKLLEPAKQELVTAEASESTKVGIIYELFCKGLKEDPKLQWDCIVDDMHSKDPWEDLKGTSPCGSASISISSWYILSMQRKGKGFTCYVTSKSLQSPVFEHI